jgi:lactoylglutathione lyase
MPQIIGQICINVSDIERSIEFWRDVLGIPLQGRTEIPNVHEAVLQAPEGGSRLQLAEHYDTPGPIEMGSSIWKLYVNSSDVKALYAKCIEYGCESVMEPTDLDRWPVTVAFIKDRDGYLIELIENHGEMMPHVPNPKHSTRE